MDLIGSTANLWIDASIIVTRYLSIKKDRINGMFQDGQDKYKDYIKLKPLLKNILA